MKQTDGLSLPNPNPAILPLLPNKLRAALSLLQVCILKPSIAPEVLAQWCEAAHRVTYPVNKANWGSEFGEQLVEPPLNTKCIPCWLTMGGEVDFYKP